MRQPSQRDGVDAGARSVLEAAWDPARGYCYPNRNVYPHLWLWDSCFHAIAWAALRDRRAVVELESALAGALPGGFLPHMRYAGDTHSRGPLADRSSFTQPPVYAHAAAELRRRGMPPGPELVTAVERALDWLWRYRLTTDGLLRVVHPWETGADDSPRWDSWVGSSDWNRPQWTQADFDMLAAVTYDADGASVASSMFEAAPAAFNAIAAHAAAEIADLTGSARWRERSVSLARAIDAVLWDEDAGQWSDLALVGGGASVGIPSLDGVLPALVTLHEDRAYRALAQLLDPDRFRGRYGLRYLPRHHHLYRPDGYWRGSSWMQMNYLALLAAQRWNDDDTMGYLGAATRAAASEASFAEHWNPETGEPNGAIPQTWSALVVAFP